MWRRGRNRVTPGMVLAWGMSSSNRGMGSSNNLYRIHNRIALGSGRGDGGSRRGHNSSDGDSGGEDAAAAAVGPVLDLSTGGGEERRTQALKLCPPRVFTIAGLEKERRWRGWEEEDRIRNEFEMKLKRGERGGGGV